MIDITQAITYIKQVIEQLELAEDSNHGAELRNEADQKQNTLDREALTARESAFLKKTAGYGEEVERIKGLHSVALRIKAQADEDLAELIIETEKLDKRRANIIDLEKKQLELESREKLLESKEAEIEERESFVKKDKKLLRVKQEELELRAKSIKRKQEQLDRMISAQRL